VKKDKKRKNELVSQTYVKIGIDRFSQKMKKLPNTDNTLE
jgi:hypothetical protein